MSATPQREPEMIAMEIRRLIEVLNRLLDESARVNVSVKVTQPASNSQRVSVEIKQVRTL